MQPGAQYTAEQYYAPPRKEIWEYLTMDLLLMLAILGGLALWWIGITVEGFGFRPYGVMVRTLGMFLLSAELFLVGMFKKEMNHWIRLAAVIAAALIVL